MVKNLETFLDLLKIFLDTVKTASPLTCCKFKEKFKNCSKGSVRMSVTFGHPIEKLLRNANDDVSAICPDLNLVSYLVIGIFRKSHINICYNQIKSHQEHGEFCHNDKN